MEDGDRDILTVFTIKVAKDTTFNSDSSCEVGSREIDALKDVKRHYSPERYGWHPEVIGLHQRAILFEVSRKYVACRWMQLVSRLRSTVLRNRLMN
jgi:hypothetical protein